MDNETLTVWLSIGRNIGAAPLAGWRWRSFCEELRSVATYFAEPFPSGNGPAVLFAGAGAGTWEEQNEDSFALLVLVDAPALPALRNELRSLAISYGQDGIGCVVHDSRFGSSVVSADSESEEL